MCGTGQKGVWGLRGQREGWRRCYIFRDLKGVDPRSGRGRHPTEFSQLPYPLWTALGAASRADHPGASWNLCRPESTERQKRKERHKKISHRWETDRERPNHKQAEKQHKQASTPKSEALTRIPWQMCDTQLNSYNYMFTSRDAIKGFTDNLVTA